MSATRVGRPSDEPNWKAPSIRNGQSKTLQWLQTSRKLKPRFASVGIKSCEIKMPQCWGNYCLAFCHTKRRADIKTQEELERVVLGCAACSTAAHGMGKHKEEEFLEKIIAARPEQP